MGQVQWIAGAGLRRTARVLRRIAGGLRARLGLLPQRLRIALFRFEPLWRWAARTYDPTPGTAARRWLVRFVHDPLWRLLYRWIYHQDVRDRVFPFVCAYWYRYPIAAGHTIVQVGASEGEETLRLARAVGPCGRVVAIEPDPKNFEALAQRVRGLDHVTAIHAGAYREAGEVDFLRGGPKAHRIDGLAADVRYLDWDGNDVDINRDYYDECTRIRVDTLDAILASHGVPPTTIDLLLVETNGSELEVLRGVSRPALERVRHVMARAHVHLDGVPIHHEVARWLRERGFETWLNAEEDVAARRLPGSAA